MDALLRVMAAKKREASVLQAEKKSKQEKYLRRAEMETILYEAEQSKYKTTSTEAAGDDADGETQQATKKRRFGRSSGEKQQSKRDNSSTDNTVEAGKADDTASDPVFTLSWPEMKKRLRDLGQPITLFGETDRERMDRLRRAEHDVAFRQEDELGEGHRTRNRFVGEKEQEDAEHADDAAEDAEDFDDNSTNASAKDPSATQMAAKSNTADGDEDSDEDKLVYRFFKTMLQSWERDLANRPDHVKRTAQGKIAMKTMKQCKDYIRPLFKLCKQRQVPSDILPNLVEIVKFCKQGEFVMANDAYIKLAIGNAAWPIGVTMVGIHERTGREKINSNKQAHVMNNEAARKYLTSVKRLISYAQSISNALPSKKVVS
uniref:Pre-mRNA-splicing factor 18 n=1 Tax=Globisporangium ultimum (strain ATCC 200006 / CBS 805.95 / DAOM BR144) TaxID=431595 RepID=K3WDK4_GLOUD